MRGQGDVFCDVHSQELCVADSFHIRTIDRQKDVVGAGVVGVYSDHFVFFMFRERLLFVHYTSVFITVAHEAYHCSSVSKPDDEVGGR